MIVNMIHDKIHSDPGGTIPSRWCVQPRRTSLLEAATQACVGLPLGFAVSYAVSMLRLPPAASAAAITGLMFAVSVARGFWIRRAYERRAMLANKAMVKFEMENWRDGRTISGSEM
jgi:hypothetical protein